MKYLITGGTGFLGKEICNQLNEETFHTLGRSSQNHILADLGNDIPNLKEKYDQVFHCAGKAHIVPKTEQEIAEFFQLNHQGTINLLKSLDNSPPKRFILISTVAVYGRETGADIDETHPLNGSTPYALSKIKAEEEVQRWGKEKKVSILILRLPLIAGPNPPGNLGKMIAGIKSGKYLSINHGKARRSVVMASDIAALIKNSDSAEGIYNLTDGYHPSFKELEQVISTQLNKSLPISIPGWIGKLLGHIGNLIPKSPINLDTINKMSQDLTFSDQKARNEISWVPSNTLKKFKIN
ncbi:NAD-dependent epimerase/dehydratase family protein [Marinoscillum pacificum]|uniref:NAD-dependent epimerase/dehydratase family protein n=1 Tax=Marinoscillum pacificum TaxID=392723 RepID=UPI002157E42A|nr:NAD-dependent epimerase/dehydratase family protein [Marinoscillum pacificum]